MSWIDFVGGSEKAFTRIYEEHVDDLYAYGVKFYADRELVLDCIHDLFLSLYGNPKISKEVESVKHYLFSSLRRRILRAKTQQDNIQIGDIPEETLWVKSHDLEMIRQENELVNVQRVKKEIDSLPKRQREVLFLKYYMDFSYEEIASVLGVNVESCRTLSYRGLRLLRTQLKPLEYAPVLFYIFFK